MRPRIPNQIEHPLDEDPRPPAEPDEPTLPPEPPDELPAPPAAPEELPEPPQPPHPGPATPLDGMTVVTATDGRRLAWSAIAIAVMVVAIAVALAGPAGLIMIVPGALMVWVVTSTARDARPRDRSAPRP